MNKDCNGCFGAAGDDCQKCQEAEESQKYLEELHGIKRGQIVTLIHFTGENRQQETLRKYKYRVVELHKYNILLESMSGLKFCPDWPKFHEMLKGATLKPW